MGNARRERDTDSRRARERDGNDSGRLLRLQGLIREEVNFILRGEIRDPRLDGVEITMVELHGECARLWFTCASDEGTMEALVHATGFMRTRLAESLGLKRIPELRFRRDPATRQFGGA